MVVGCPDNRYVVALVGERQRYRLRSRSDREVIREVEPGTVYVDRESGEEFQIVGNRRMSDPPPANVQTVSQMRVFAQSLLPAMIGECQHIRQGCVVERDR